MRVHAADMVLGVDVRSVGMIKRAMWLWCGPDVAGILLHAVLMHVHI